MTRVTEYGTTLHYLPASLHKLVADFQANGNSRELGDPTAAAWFEAAQQVLDAIAGWTDTPGRPRLHGGQRMTADATFDPGTQCEGGCGCAPEHCHCPADDQPDLFGGAV